ncbi:hypothetical protein C427_0987 [Paraglaciecola psychrophila 170]|uniref:Nucleotidyl transferase n=1 Tax=Paraglaciecola psychrophila 170 TaxID=1129794 RepID=M4RHP2_9ALTE|nr:hypothetical protein C427_0987 [Paraglaciecola psychrophila 170]
MPPMWRTAINQGLIAAQHFTGQWIDVGTPQRLNALNKKN